MLFFVLPILAGLMYPPATLAGGSFLLLIPVAAFIALGILILRGNSLSLTFSIFLQGMNVIIRLMMFFSNAVDKSSFVDVPYIITSLLGLGISLWLLFRLDKQDIRREMH